LYASYMDVVYSLKPLAALTMTPHHHLGSPIPQLLKSWPLAGVFNRIIDICYRLLIRTLQIAQ
jgi:hypothetical protein